MNTKLFNEHEDLPGDEMRLRVHYSPNRFRLGGALVLLLLSALLNLGHADGNNLVEARPVPGQSPDGYLEIQGVAAGLFNPNHWEDGTLHLLPDHRSPMLTPSWTGTFRNIYAPSAVETESGWRLFYGAWDGVRTGNDRIYSALSHDFLDFFDRTTVIEHGPFIHVCNVNAIPLGKSGFTMACTAYPDKEGLNKPILFESSDGRNWNCSPEPYAASMDDLVLMTGYPAFAEADINGTNALLREGEDLRLYFNNNKDSGRVYRATAKGNAEFHFEGAVLETSHGVNEVKKLSAKGEDWYLMGLHRNTDRIWYSLSRDGMSFPPEKELAVHEGESDRFMVAVGWVVRGNRLLGVLYGAGAAPTLDRNRIFARWLQRKAVFIADDGTRYEPTASLGPDRQLIPLPDERPKKGSIQLYEEDGLTPIGEPVILDEFPRSGILQVLAIPSEEEFENLLDPELSNFEGPGGGPASGWSLVGETLAFSGEGSYLKFKNGDIGDFVLRMDYRLPPGGNSGLYFRHPQSGLESGAGMEIQILDHHHEQYNGIKDWQFTGSIYGVVPPSSKDIHPGGEWNSIEVYALGPRIRVTLNGQVVADASMDDYRDLQSRPRRGLMALQAHGSSLEFRNIRMKRLD